MGTFHCKLLRQFACKLQNMYQVIARGGKQATAFNTSNMRTHYDGQRAFPSAGAHDCQGYSRG